MSTKLTFTEELTGWDVKVPDSHQYWDGGRLEQTIKRGWVFAPSGLVLTLPELDQIRHKLANLEQVRLLKLETEKNNGN